jgi:hypothetical protein
MTMVDWFVTDAYMKTSTFRVLSKTMMGDFKSLNGVGIKKSEKE